MTAEQNQLLPPSDLRLVILDRDGVINEDSDDYIRSVEEWRPIPGSIEALGMMANSGLLLAVATNQSGVGRGYYDLDTLEAMHVKLHALAQKQGARISRIEYCVHVPGEHCTCRKPRPGMLLNILDALDVRPQQALMVGDSPKDVQAAGAAGVRAVAVLTGKGQRMAAEGRVPVGTPVFADLAAVAHWLIASRLS